MRSRVVATLLAAVVCLLAGPASAIELHLLVDADRDSSTGCATPQMPGVEHVLVTTLEGHTDAWHVGDVSLRSCTSGVLGQLATLDEGGWPAMGSHPIVETFMPLSALAGPIGEGLRLGFVIVRGTRARAIATGAGDESLDFPGRSTRRRAVESPGSPRILVLDGLGDDWIGLDPFVSNRDPEIPAIYVHAGTAMLYVRFDLALKASPAAMAQDDDYSVVRGSSITIAAPGVLANDVATEAHLLVGPLHGGLDLRTDGRFTYAHDGGASHLDSFEYEARRGDGTPDRGRVSIEIFDLNLAPVAGDDDYAASEDVSLTIEAPGLLANDYDPDAPGVALVVTRITREPEHGAVALGAGGAFTYTPEANYYGADSFAYEIEDQDGSTAVAEVSVDVAPVNDVPLAAAGEASVTSLEDGGVVAVALVSMNPGPNELTQRIQFTTTVLSIDGPLTFTLPPSIDEDGTLRYESAPNAWGTALLHVAFTDDGGTANGGVDTGEPFQFQLIVQSVNDLPAARDDSYAATEDVPLTVAAPGLLANDSDTDGALVVTRITREPEHGTVALGAGGAFTYTPEANYYGADSFAYEIEDEDGGTAVAEVSVDVAPVNDAPLAGVGNDSITLTEDAGVLAVPLVGMNPGPREAMQRIQFTTTVLSIEGPLTFTLPPSIDEDGTLRYESAPNAWGTALLHVAFTDDGGTANGGVDTGEPFEFQLIVRNVNDPPTLTLSDDALSFLEDTTFVLPGFATKTAGPYETDEVSYSVYSVPVWGSAEFTATLTPDGTLTLVPVANTFGGRNLVVIAFEPDGSFAERQVRVEIVPVNDPPEGTLLPLMTTEDSIGRAYIAFSQLHSGPLENEHVETSVRVLSTTGTLAFAVPPSTGGGIGLSWDLVPDTTGEALLEFTLRDDAGTANGGSDTTILTAPLIVMPTNDAPSFTPGEYYLTFQEDAPAYAALWATDISAGGPDEAAQQLTFTVTRVQGTLPFTTEPCLDASGVLRFEVAPDVWGSTLYRVLLRDDEGAETFGFFLINVTPVNDPPTFTMAAEAIGDEDAFTTIPNFITSRSAGPDEPGDVIFYTRVLSTTGSLRFVNGPYVQPDGTLNFRPAPDTNGTALVEVNAFDGFHTSAPQAFTLVVRPVNDPPVFFGAASSSYEDDGPVSRQLFLQAYPPDEVNDLVTFAFRRIGGSLTFTTPPSVDAARVMTFETAPDANGEALFEVIVTDAGGLSSNYAEILIVVYPVNDSPTFEIAPDPVVDEDAGRQIISGFAYDISAGPPDESQTVTFQINSGSSTVNFSEPPSITGNGDLTFRAHDNQSGTFNADLLVLDSAFAYAIRPFSITVRPVNDPPSFDVLAGDLRPAIPASISIPAFVTNISPGPLETGTVSFVLTPDDSSIFAAGGLPAVGPDGTLTYALNGTGGRTTVTIVAHDAGGGTLAKSFALVADLVPAVVATSPADGEGGVVGNSSITVTFNETVSILPPSPIGLDGTFALHCGAGLLPYTVDVLTGTVFTIDPAASLPTGTCTLITIATRVSDGDADDPPDQPAADHSFSFHVVNEPVAVGESFDAVGNVTLTIAAPGVLANDTDPAGLPLAVVPEILTGSGGGSLELFADGSFRYLSQAGAGLSPANETFTYSVTNGAYLATAVLSMNISGRYWYVQHDAAAGGDGRDTAPFQTLTAAIGVATAGETILVLAGGAGSLSENVVLEAGQSIIGQGISAPLTIPLNGNPVTLLAPATAPLLTSAAGITLNVHTGNTISGMAITSSNGQAIAGSGVGTLTITETSVQAVGGEALMLSTGTLNGSFETLSSSNSVSAGVTLQQIDGTLVAAAGTIEGAAGGGVSISGNLSFTYPGNITHAGTNQVIAIMNHTAGEIAFDGAISSTGGGILLHTVSAGSLTFNGPVTLTTGASAAIDGVFLAAPLNVVFSGGLTATTTTADAIAFRGGTIEISGTANSITTSGGHALYMHTTSVAPGGIRFDQIDTTATATSAISLTFVTGPGQIEIGGGTMSPVAVQQSPVTVALSNLTVRGVRPLTLDTFGTLAVSQVTLDGTSAIFAKSGTLTGTFASVTSLGTDGAFTFIDIAGALAIPSGSVTVSGGTANAIIVQGGSVDLDWSAALTYGGVNLAVSVAGGHTGTLTFNGDPLDINSGAGLGFNAADGAYSFLAPMTIDGVTQAIAISNGSDGTFVFGDAVDIGATLRPSALAFLVDASTPDVTFDGELHGGSTALYMQSVPNVAGRAITFGPASVIDTVTASANAILATSVDIPVSLLGSGTLAGTAAINSGGANATFTFGPGMHIAPAANVAAFTFSGASDVLFAGSMTQAANASLVTISSQSAESVIEFSGALDATSGTGIAIGFAAGEVHFTGTTTLHGGDAAIDITTGTTGMQTFGSATSVTDPTGIALQISNASGQVTYDGSLTKSAGTGEVVSITNMSTGSVTLRGAISASSGAGIFMSGLGADVSFEGTTMLSGGAGVVASVLASGDVTFNAATSIVSGAATPLTTVSVHGSFTYLGSLTQNHDARLIDIHGAFSPGRIDFTGGQPLLATNGTGIRVANGSTGGAVTFTAPVSLSGGDAGIDLQDSFAAVHFGPLVTMGAISGNLIHATGGLVRLRYESPLASAAGPLVVIENSGSTGAYVAGNPMDVTFTASMTKSGNGSAIVLQNTGATVEFLGAMDLSSSGGAAAVILSSGNRARFAGGDLDITTSGVAGLVSDFTWLEVLGSSNEIVATGAPALDLADSMVTEGGMTFARIDVDGGSTGIMIHRTSGFENFVVNGGTIENVTGRGVEIVNARPPVLRNLSFANVATAAGAPCSLADNSGCNAAIHLSIMNGGGTVPSVLENITIDGSSQNGINVNQGDRLEFSDLAITNVAGTAVHIQTAYVVDVTDVDVASSADGLVIDSPWATTIVRGNFGGANVPLSGRGIHVRNPFALLTIDDASVVADGGLLLETDGSNRTNAIVRNSMFDVGGVEVVVAGAGSPCAAVDLDANAFVSGAPIDLLQTTGTLRLPGYPGPDIATWLSARNGGAPVSVTGANIVAGASCP